MLASYNKANCPAMSHTRVPLMQDIFTSHNSSPLARNIHFALLPILLFFLNHSLSGYPISFSFLISILSPSHVPHASLILSLSSSHSSHHTHGSCFTHTHGLGVDFWVFFLVFSSQSFTGTLTAQISLSVDFCNSRFP